MPDTSQKEIIRALRTLREFSPAQGISEAAVHRALERVRQYDAAPQPMRRRHFLLRGSIAAGLLLVAGTLWFMVKGGEVSAAELLQQSLDASNGYRGWVHMILEQDAQLPNGIRGEEHLNRTDGTRVIVTRDKEKTWIRMDIPSRGETAEYDSRTNQIKLGDMIPYNVEVAKKTTAGAQIDLASTLARFKEATGREPLSISRRQEGSQERIDIHYFADLAEATKTLKPLRHWGSLPLEATLWIDPKSKLIQRASVVGVSRYEDGIRQEPLKNWRITYGPPELKDIYAAGAPRDAIVEDHRMIGKAGDLWNRLNKRFEEAYGDGIALLAGAELKDDGSIDQASGTIQLYIRQGPRRYYGEFYVTDQPSRTGRRRIKPFADWPNPELHEVLRRAQVASPSTIFMTDGNNAWAGDEHAKLLDKKERVGWEKSYPPTVATVIWPTRSRLGLYNTQTSFQILPDIEHPEWLLLQSRRHPSTSPGARLDNPAGKECLHWLDTSRDDMPIRIVQRDFDKDGQTIMAEYERVFLEHQQLTNGLWYPARWTLTVKRMKEGKLVAESNLEYRLRIFPDAVIDPVWFRPPDVTE